MTLKLNKDVVSLKGEPMGERLNNVLANILAMSSVGKPAQMITWAVNLTNKGEIEVTKQDAAFLKELIENHRGVINLAKMQLIKEIDLMIEGG